VNSELQILILEDERADVELINDELRRGGINFRSRWVETAEQVQQELKYHTPDLVLSDHGLPHFSGEAVLALVRDHDPNLPFIFVTGALGEEMAIKAFERGADDCVMKHNLSDLSAAVRRALARAGQRARLTQAEAEVQRLTQELHDARVRLRATDRLLPICSGCKKIRDEHEEWRDLESYLNRRLALKFTHGLCPECAQRYFTGFV
jgi:DNA-binding response OmpR family regulator